MSESMPDDIKAAVEQIASDLEDIHFNSRHTSWLDSAKEIVAAAILAERERDAKIALEACDEHGFWDDGVEIAAAIRTLRN